MISFCVPCEFWLSPERLSAVPGTTEREVSEEREVHGRKNNISEIKKFFQRKAKILVSDCKFMTVSSKMRIAFLK